MISVICPVYNERDNLRELYDRVRSVFESIGERFELIFVDDASDDGGSEILAEVQKRDPRIRLIRLKKNSGKSIALYAGFSRAKGNVLASLDADMQVPPEEFSKLWPFLKEGVDIVAGIRTPRCDHWMRKVSSRIANNMRRKILKDQISDIGCPLFILRRESARYYFSFVTMHRFFLSIAERNGVKIVQVPVKHEKRRFGRAKYGLKNRTWCGLWDLISIAWLLNRYRNERGNEK